VLVGLIDRLVAAPVGMAALPVREYIVFARESG
jgi:hypothetical protein